MLTATAVFAVLVLVWGSAPMARLARRLSSMHGFVPAPDAALVTSRRTRRERQTPFGGTAARS